MFNVYLLYAYCRMTSESIQITYTFCWMYLNKNINKYIKLRLNKSMYYY